MSSFLSFSIFSSIFSGDNNVPSSSYMQPIIALYVFTIFFPSSVSWSAEATCFCIIASALPRCTSTDSESSSSSSNPKSTTSSSVSPFLVVLSLSSFLGVLSSSSSSSLNNLLSVSFNSLPCRSVAEIPPRSPARKPPPTPLPELFALPPVNARAIK